MLFKGSFDDYLYILIGIIWVAFSIYKGIQKKKTISGSPKESKSENKDESKKSFFDDFLNQIIVEDEKIPYEPVTDEQPKSESFFNKQETEEKVFSYDDVVEESNFAEKNSVYEDKPAAENYFQEELKSHLKSKKKQSRFDLRKAIIYSEIMNRRYF